jgi:hypothetical protein
LFIVFSERDEKCTEYISWKNLKGRYYLEDQNVHGAIILEWILAEGCGLEYLA